MPLPPPPPGFVLDTQGAGRPIFQQRPPQPSPQTPAQAQGDILGNRGKQLDISTRSATQPFDVRKAAAEAVKSELEAQQLREKRAAQQRDASGAIGEIINVIDSAAQAHRMSRKRWTTGYDGRAAAVVGATPRKDIEGLLATIGSNTAFSRLQKMREQSPTGGALGNVSNVELDLLRSTIASLDPNQSDKQFQDNMQKIVRTYGGMLKKLPGGKDAFLNWRKQFLGQGKKQPQQKPRVIDFNDLPE